MNKNIFLNKIKKNLDNKFFFISDGNNKLSGKKILQQIRIKLKLVKRNDIKDSTIAIIKNCKSIDYWINFLPWLDLPNEAFESESESVKFWLNNPHLDPWGLQYDAMKVQVPNLNLIGWSDHCNGNMLLDKTIMKTTMKT